MDLDESVIQVLFPFQRNGRTNGRAVPIHRCIVCRAYIWRIQNGDFIAHFRRGVGVERNTRDHPIVVCSGDEDAYWSLPVPILLHLDNHGILEFRRYPDLHTFVFHVRNSNGRDLKLLLSIFQGSNPPPTLRLPGRFLSLMKGSQLGPFSSRVAKMSWTTRTIILAGVIGVFGSMGYVFGFSYETVIDNILRLYNGLSAIDDWYS